MTVQSPMTVTSSLSTGDIAPDFVLPATDGSTMHLYEVLERSPVVLFFYLKAFTPVCTAQVCSFRQNTEEFRDHGAAVYGISSDSLGSAERFATVNRLSFPLLSDAEGKVRQLYRVPKAFGFLPGRSTYVINQDRTIRTVVHSQLSAQSHVTQSLRAFGAGTNG